MGLHILKETRTKKKKNKGVFLQYQGSKTAFHKRESGIQKVRTRGKN